MGDLEALAGHGIDIVAFELLTRRETDRMHDHVQAVPTFGQGGEGLVDLRVAAHVQWQHDIAAEICSRIRYAALQLVGLISQCQFCTLPMHGPGNAVGNRAITGNTDDQDALALKKTHTNIL